MDMKKDNFLKQTKNVIYNNMYANLSYGLTNDVKVFVLTGLNEFEEDIPLLPYAIRLDIDGILVIVIDLRGDIKASATISEPLKDIVLKNGAPKYKIIQGALAYADSENKLNRVYTDIIPVLVSIITNKVRSSLSLDVYDTEKLSEAISLFLVNAYFQDMNDSERAKKYIKMYPHTDLTKMEIVTLFSGLKNEIDDISKLVNYYEVSIRLKSLDSAGFINAISSLTYSTKMPLLINGLKDGYLMMSLVYETMNNSMLLRSPLGVGLQRYKRLAIQDILKELERIIKDWNIDL